MAIDMFMQKQTDFIQNSVMLQVDGEIVNSSRIKSIIESVGFWRDFYPMHEWIVDNVQAGEDDQGRYWLTPENIKDLADHLTIVKEWCPEWGDQCDTTISQLHNYLNEDNITPFSAFYYQGI